MDSPLSALALLPFSLILAGPEAQYQAPATFRSEVRMVLVPVTVTDRNGGTITGLDERSFKVLDNNIEQGIASFEGEDAPCSVALVLDISGSMRSVLGTGKAVLEAFLRVSNPDDEFALFTVSSAPGGGGGFTSDPGLLQNHLLTTKSGGSTALVDTIQEALDRLRAARNSRRAVLVISDGMDNHSRRSKSELMRAAVESDAQIYTIALNESGPLMKGVELAESQIGLGFMQDLSTKTGGLSFVVRDADSLNRAAAKAGRAIRDQYVIGYVQAGVESGKWHRISVKLGGSSYRVAARNGYYLP